MSQLFLSNIPWNCPESEVQEWIEARGFPVTSIHVIRDEIANASPSFAYVTLCDNSQNENAIKAMNGQQLKDRTLQVKLDWRSASHAAVSTSVRRTIKE